MPEGIFSAGTLVPFLQIFDDAADAVAVAVLSCLPLWETDLFGYYLVCGNQVVASNELFTR